ncbi:hypothetical protein [Pseudomonas synxantha]|nr:hypothetical protein [Pseudomonas synxantha]
MNGSLPLAYTNQVSPEYLRNLDKSPFTERQLASFDEQALAIVNQQRSYAKASPDRYLPSGNCGQPNP